MSKKHPSFKATFGRAPIAGQDYNPDKGLSQDDYEFLTGTGQYSDDVRPEGPSPEKIKRTAEEYSRIAKEPVTAEFIAGTLYIFGSELASLRIYYHNRHNKTARAAYSQNRRILVLLPRHEPLTAPPADLPTGGPQDGPTRPKIPPANRKEPQTMFTGKVTFPRQFSQTVINTDPQALGRWMQENGLKSVSVSEYGIIATYYLQEDGTASENKPS